MLNPDELVGEEHPPAIEEDWLHVGLGYYFGRRDDGSVLIGHEAFTDPPPGTTSPTRYIEGLRLIDRQMWERVVAHVG